MPWSVFFADGGIAFHSGSPTRSSAGCIHLSDPDARAWFNYMAMGDQVQVVKASQELPRHNGQPAVSKKAGEIDPLRGIHDDSAPATDSSDGSNSDDDSDEGVNKVKEGRPHVVDLLKDGQIDLVITTVDEKRLAIADSRSIRTTALAQRVTYYTTIAGGRAAVEGMRYLAALEVYDLQSLHRENRPEVRPG